MGKVILVGAGPGDKELITVKGLKAIKEADVIVYDDLIDKDLLNYNKNAELIYVGKRKGRHSYKQEDINKILIEKAKEGKTVVRLKGGDPFIFGRGGEEILALKEHNIPYEIIPGLSSATALPALAEIPLTHRKVARSFTVLTAHIEDGEVDFTKFNGDTLVILMGITKLKKIVNDLLKVRDKKTPIAIILKGATKEQKVIRGTLEDILDKAKNIEPPGIIVVGEVVNILQKN
ncbi:uroporphyrin-III C-methyltransferase [Methanocaldococcus villosus KIN24-T80]|uniref:uroporphyrinogen-III C-methyltransferase n=1 Tax=Methanocaldococcus villosus KIN24-T80 TaxID=1069083 RepID=N6VRF9_9EURY|nr:uroporphyrinogen-III C-methyltransferase [Methanocaldococcus villosus]ENN96475.1 uroporphyrin-III C-methyltransferase [Methanocaldococcus villosus KIN24-T80]